LTAYLNQEVNVWNIKNVDSECDFL
jgi:hypothetical protein